MPSFPLSVKQSLVGTGVGRVLWRARWWAGFLQRTRHPELWDMYLEDQRIEVALATLVDPDSNCLDIGAHVGSTLSQLARRAPDGRHIAIEPGPEKAESLRQRFPDVRVITAAVGDEPGIATFYQARASGYSSLRPPIQHEVSGEIEVEVVRIDDVVSGELPIHFVKLDVEGAELPALQGAGDLIKREQPIVMFESGPVGHTDPFGYNRRDLFDYLDESDYEIYAIVDFVYGRAPMTVDEFEKAGTYPYRGFNYLALPAGTKIARLL